MSMIDKRTQILALLDAYGLKRPKDMPKDFARMEYPDGVGGAADYAYHAAKMIFTCAATSGKLTASFKSDLKDIMTKWATLVYSSAIENATETASRLAAIYEKYKMIHKEEASMTFASEVAKYCKQTVDGLLLMKEDESFLVGARNAAFYNHAAELTLMCRSAVLAATETESPEANVLARKILYGEDGKGGVVGFRAGVSTGLIFSTDLLEKALNEAKKWAFLNTGNTKKIKKSELVTIEFSDNFSLHAEMPNLANMLENFSSTVEHKKNVLSKQYEKKQEEREKVEREISDMDKMRFEANAQRLNGTLTPEEALLKVKELNKKIETKRKALDADQVEQILAVSIDMKEQLYKAVEYIIQLWKISEVILSVAERHELFGSFPYAEVLEVLNGNSEHEDNVAQMILVARSGMQTKLEMGQKTNARFAKILQQTDASILKTTEKKKEHMPSIDKNKQASDELDAMFGSVAMQNAEEPTKIEQKKPKLEDLLL